MKTKKETTVQARASLSEIRTWKAKAASVGLSLSGLIRMLLTQFKG